MANEARGPDSRKLVECADSCFLGFSDVLPVRAASRFLSLSLSIATISFAFSSSSSSTSATPAMTFLTALVKPLAYLSVPAFALHTLAKSNPLIRYYVRIGLFLSTLGICSVWGVICSIGMGLVGRRFDVFYVIARSFYYLTSPVIGVRLEVEGEEYLETRPSVLVGNHQSMFDILYLGRCVHPPPLASGVQL